MNSEEYDHSHYLSDNVYPASILQLKNSRHAKKTFRLKASQYQLGENGKIFKVIFNSIQIVLYIYIIKTRLVCVCVFVCLFVCPDCIEVMGE